MTIVHDNENALTNSPAFAPTLPATMDAFCRAANNLTVGQICLHDNPVLRRQLVLADVKHMRHGHWGCTPGQNFIHVHLKRIVKQYILAMLYVSDSGCRGPALVGNNLDYTKEGTSTAPLDMAMHSEFDHFHLAIDSIDSLPQTCEAGLFLKRQFKDKAIQFRRDINLQGQEVPEIGDWTWAARTAPKRL